MTVKYFGFEEGFIEEDIRCIPMIVRFKLDACGIKLKLAEWSKMTPGERSSLAESRCHTHDELTAYRQHVQQLVRKYFEAEATELRIDPSPLWASLAEVPGLLQQKLKDHNLSVSLSQWQNLSALQRFALLKLSSGGHESKNFARALKEFNLS